MTVKDILLCSSENGNVYQCGFFSLLVLTFKGHWMVFDLDGYLRFRNQVGLAMCPRGRQLLAANGLRLIGDNEGYMLSLGMAEVEELISLLDSAHAKLSVRIPEMDWTRVNIAVEAELTAP